MVQLRLHQVVHPQSLSKHWLRTLSHHHSPSRKAFVSDAASWNALRKDLQTEQIQWPRALVVRSFSENPYVNLAIENYLLGYSHPESRIYFFYVNRPCIVIGRNQNPWLEVNLQKLREHSFPVDLVRRRSGGGAVFHDYGNLNYCAIVPSNVFTRDLHAQALADGLNKAAIDKVAGSFSVNDRHDVVLCAENGPQPLKVSGSAYKLTKGRALHHGTCLVASPNLSQISQYLRSPSRPFIRAKGVESVSSKIGNVSSLSFDFLEESKMLGVVMDDLMYSFVDSAMHPANKPGVDNDLLYHWINDPECLDTREHNGLREVIDKIFADAAELKVSCNVPIFSFSPWRANSRSCQIRLGVGSTFRRRASLSPVIRSRDPKLKMALPLLHRRNQLLLMLSLTGSRKTNEFIYTSSPELSRAATLPVSAQISR